MRFEQKDYDACISDCKKAIEDGRALRADFKIIARAYERMGNALVKTEKLDEAMKAYSDSLVENRTKEVRERGPNPKTETSKDSLGIAWVDAKS